MQTAKLKKFAQLARLNLMEKVSIKLQLVLSEGSAARRESARAVTKLEENIGLNGKEHVIERVAYIWFNRFCALRFMDINRYNRIGMVSPAEGQFQPEILAEAKMGHVDEEMVPEKMREQIFALLDGKAPSRDPQSEVYRLLVVAACNYWHKAMPFLFGRIDDYTELLMPDDLLSDSSILTCICEAMTSDDANDVEVIGWLYQFYISEKKDSVFLDLKNNIKITPEKIPAATQLFTPHWIVRYLVENSLGRLWMLNRPNSRLVEQMDYYIKPEQPESDFLHINNPEEIKICDPACGSGHMLVYAFDLLFAIYEEEGYEPSEIPEKILTYNLYGIEIDERAGELAAFALCMKARSKQRRFFRKPVQPNICVLKNIYFEDDELGHYMDFVGRELFTDPLKTTLHQFEEADNFGSLIRPEMTDVSDILKSLEEMSMSNLFFDQTHKDVLLALRQVDFLSPKYHVVVANPPYMGGKGMNGGLAAWLKDNYEDVKSDLFSAFIVRNTELALPNGHLGFMTPFVWMFISSYEKLRNFLINKKTITSLVQLEYSGFDGATVPICTFTIENSYRPDFKGGYVRLSDFRGSENQEPKTLEAIKNPTCGWFYRASSAEFNKIPGSPIAYWVSDNVVKIFERHHQIYEVSISEGQNITADNDKYLRLCWEVNKTKIEPAGKWSFYAKGGSYRKWFGNLDYVVDWSDEARNHYHKHPSARIIPKYLRFREGITWTLITSSHQSFRFLPDFATFDKGGSSIFFNETINLKKTLLFLNTKISAYLTKLYNASLNLQVDDVRKLPLSPERIGLNEGIYLKLITNAKNDWDSYETSWDFACLPLLNPDYQQPTLKVTYQKLRTHWREMTLEMQRLEEENNRIFIEAYGLQDELTPEVPLNEITLTCNPYYRYRGNKTEEALEALLLADTMKEFISYAVGCMFGRYALEKPGLILANQGDIFTDYLKQIPEPQFSADEDNVIPILDNNWFTDDVSERFREFLRTTFGEDSYEENLQFLENAIGKDIRKYFLKDFYTDHVKLYKKRPIYWLFSSPKGSFNALIYMHRYKPDTVSIVLNDYLREYRSKLTAHLEHLKRIDVSADAAKGEKIKALKEIENLKKVIDELDTWEHEVLYPLATEQIEINLDDGVKVNYAKFGTALRKIPGLDKKDD